MKGILKSIVHEMNYTELRIAMLAVLAWVQSGYPITLRDLQEIIEESRRP